MQVGGQGGGERAEPSEISRCCSRLSESMDARTTMAVEVQSEGLKKLRAFPSLSSPRSALRPLSFIVKVKLLAGVQLWPAARRRCPPSCSFPFPSRPRSSVLARDQNRSPKEGRGTKARSGGRRGEREEREKGREREREKERGRDERMGERERERERERGGEGEKQPFASSKRSDPSLGEIGEASFRLFSLAALSMQPLCNDDDGREEAVKRPWEARAAPPRQRRERKERLEEENDD
jgi:hypothetical protein